MFHVLAQKLNAATHISMFFIIYVIVESPLRCLLPGQPREARNDPGARARSTLDAPAGSLGAASSSPVKDEEREGPLGPSRARARGGVLFTLSQKRRRVLVRPPDALPLSGVRLALWGASGRCAFTPFLTCPSSRGEHSAAPAHQPPPFSPVTFTASRQAHVPAPACWGGCSSTARTVGL